MAATKTSESMSDYLLNLQAHAEPYAAAARELCHGSRTKAFFGSLLEYTGPLSVSERNYTEGTGYVLRRPAHPSHLQDDRFNNHTLRLDFTIPPRIRVHRGDTSEMAIDEFVEVKGWGLVMPPEFTPRGRTGDHVGAFSAALEAEFEKTQLGEVTAPGFRGEAGDLGLRSANIDALLSELCGYVRAAHNIAEPMQAASQPDSGLGFWQAELAVGFLPVPTAAVNGELA